MTTGHPYNAKYVSPALDAGGFGDIPLQFPYALPLPVPARQEEADIGFVSVRRST
jgi:hypothetical protein